MEDGKASEAARANHHRPALAQTEIAPEADAMSTELRITGLFTYPIKSCGAVAHERIDFDAFGLAWDRRWMLVDGAGDFVTQRTLPRLALARPTVIADELQVTAPGQPTLRVPLRAPHPTTSTVQVWGDRVEAWDEGDIAADWFHNYTGTELRLVRFPDDAIRPINPKYNTLPGATTAFADGFPLLLATEESLADLNQKLVHRGGLPIPMSRFRPNVVLTGAAYPFAEDDWLSVRSGERQLDIVKPCSRCVMTTTDQATGNIPVRGEPLATLAQYRRWENHVAFAQNVVAHGRGPLTVHAPVHVALQGIRNRWGIWPAIGSAA